MKDRLILNVLEKYVVSENIKLSEIPKTTRLEELGITSISFIKFIVDVEKTFGIEILDSDLIISNFYNIDILCKTISKYINEKYSSKKVLVCDCDDVLWTGIAGEEKISIEANNKEFHLMIKRIIERGGIVCICSKNTKKNIEQTFNSSILAISLNDMAVIKTDTNNKCCSIEEIGIELNLSLDSFVFVDNSDYEIGYINVVFPEIITVKFGSDFAFFEEQINCLFPNIESLNRTQLFFEQKQREKEKELSPSISEYNFSLKTVLSCELATSSQFMRMAELSQRTNQFNLSNNKYCIKEIEKMYSSGKFDFYVLSAKDKYGDMGIVGAAIVEKSDKILIKDFYISCRVFDREFEDYFIEFIKKQYKKSTIYGIINISEKNKKFSDFYKRHKVLLYGNRN